MMKNFIEELKWRGMLHDMMPGAEQLLKTPQTGYIGFDPTADSLHVGSLVQIMTLLHFQRCGHKPIALVGGATGMVGDPSGKSEERNLLSEDIINHNLAGIKKQLQKFIDFSDDSRGAMLVNNYDWFKDFKLLDFIRDVGKHITISYMMAKDSVQKRLETGLSFTEFTYQLIQGYDFLYLYRKYGCKLQMGGSDQWGNMVTGTELIRRIDQGEAYAITTKLITKSDGSKFGKTESGNIWLDAKRTSPYRFYQFWLNTSDEDAENFLRIFTLKEKEECEALILSHKAQPHLRILQKALAEDITARTHSADDLKHAAEASEILFGKATADNLASLSEAMLLEIMDGVPQFTVSKNLFENGINAVELLAVNTSIFPSKSEARKMISAGGVSLNKTKLTDANAILNKDFLIKNRYLVVQKGKKNYYLVIAS
jgi:tyrosyl-tRNA synthetase